MREMNMFTNVIIVIDGSKFKAVNNKKWTYTPKKAKDLIARFDASISHYLAILSDKEKQEYSDEDVTVMQEKVAWIKNKLAELADIDIKVNEHHDKQFSLTDPDLRLIKTSNMVRQVCYNVQSTVDSQQHLIISHEVTQSTDRGKLHLVASQVQEALGMHIENLAIAI
jgi:hypothetical protein